MTAVVRYTMPQGVPQRIADLLAAQQCPLSEAVVMIGEIGGDEEEKASAFVAEHLTKPVVSYIAGVRGAPGKRMGHAGAIISGSSGTA